MVMIQGDIREISGAAIVVDAAAVKSSRVRAQGDVGECGSADRVVNAAAAVIDCRVGAHADVVERGGAVIVVNAAAIIGCCIGTQGGKVDPRY